MCYDKRHMPALSRIRLLLILGAFFFESLGRADFVPLPLTSGSFNQDIVVENTASAPVISGGYTTASMDSGTGNTSTSWYEQGYNLTNLTSGLPTAGSTFTNQNAANHQ